MNNYASMLLQGLYNTELSFSSTITTASGSDGVLTGMTVTPPAGTYLVIFGTWLTHSTGNATVTMSVYAGGVQNAGSIRTMMPFSGAVGSANNGMQCDTNAIVKVNGAQAIAVEWHTSTATATAHNGTMDIVKIA